MSYGREPGTPYVQTFFCKENKIIHPNLNQTLKCIYCVTQRDRDLFEARQRMNWFLQGYRIHNLGRLFSKMTTEEICKQFNIKLNYFKPWL